MVKARMAQAGMYQNRLEQKRMEKARMEKKEKEQARMEQARMEQARMVKAQMKKTGRKHDINKHLKKIVFHYFSQNGQLLLYWTWFYPPFVTCEVVCGLKLGLQLKLLLGTCEDMELSQGEGICAGGALGGRMIVVLGD